MRSLVTGPLKRALTDIARGPFCCRRLPRECLCPWCADIARRCRDMSAPRRSWHDSWCCRRQQTRAPTWGTGLGSFARYPVAHAHRFIISINPLMGIGNYSATSNNTKLVHWPLMCGLLHLVQRGGDWAGPQPAQSPPRCTKLQYF